MKTTNLVSVLVIGSLLFACSSGTPDERTESDEGRVSTTRAPSPTTEGTDTNTETSSTDGISSSAGTTGGNTSGGNGFWNPPWCQALHCGPGECCVGGPSDAHCAPGCNN